MPYQPVSCALHSELELAIMRRTPLTLEWEDAHGAHHHARLQPRDLSTTKAGEFLLADTATAQRVEIRLDKIAGISNS